MDKKNIAKLLTFPTVPKADRLAERCKIVAHNFHDPDIGINLMLYMTRKMYEAIASQDADWIEGQILAKLCELENYLAMYEEENDENRDPEKT